MLIVYEPTSNLSIAKVHLIGLGDLVELEETVNLVGCVVTHFWYAILDFLRYGIMKHDMTTFGIW